MDKNYQIDGQNNIQKGGLPNEYEPNGFNRIKQSDKTGWNMNISLASTNFGSVISSNSSNADSSKNEPQKSLFMNSGMSLDQKILTNRPMVPFNLDNNISPYSQHLDIRSQPCKQVPKTINISNLQESDKTNQFNPPPNYRLTKIEIKEAFKSQKTTIVLQKIIMEEKDEVINAIVYELKGEYREIINDKNGNYFSTDLFKICNQSQRIFILEELRPYLSEDCISNFATHPIQTLVEFSSSEKEYELILFSFNDYNKLLSASLDPNGAYVIQKIIERIPERFRKDFNYIFISFIGFVSKQKFGIVAVKKFISCTKNEDIIAQILNIIKVNFMSLANDKYGNYLIQFLLEKWGNYPEGNEIKKLIIQNFKVMAHNKYSSFICELLIKFMKDDEKVELIKSLDLNEFKNSNNQNAIKVMNLLGINMINSNNNINNNYNNIPNQMNLPLNFNNNSFIQNSNIQPNFPNPRFNNINNFGNNNNGERTHKYKQNNNKNRYKNNNK